MRYLYTLPVVAILFLILVMVVAIFTQVLVASFNILIEPKKKKPVISHIFNISLIIYYCIICGIIASIQRHLTEGIISFDYYTTLRYLGSCIIITSILNVIFNREYHNLGISVTAIILLPIFEDVFKNGYSYVYIICVLYYLVYSIYLALTLFEYNKKNINNLSIKEALDSLPIGICFANKKSRIIFNNKTMINILNYNGIESRIKIIDLWNEIKSKDFIFDDENTGLLKYNDETFMVVLDKANDLEYQIKATNISAEYEIIDEILKANQTLEEQEKSLKDYIVKIEEIERQKSLLRVKGRIHDVFAQRLSIIHQYLDNEDIKNISNEEIKKLLIDMTKDIKEENELNYDDIKNNIISSYALIGMKIDFIGDFNDKEGQNGILKIVREAATNALRHGGATELKVEYKNGIITITNNGVEPNVIKEGNGIKNMKFIAKENKLDLSIELKPYRIIIK